MNLVETHIISPNNPNWIECDTICFKSKNLYNSALYLINNQYKETNEYLNYHNINKQFIKENNESYRALPAKVAQQTLMLIDKNYKSYFNSLKSYNKNPNKFNGLPKPPMFKHKTKGRFITIYTQQAISIKLLKKGILNLSGTNIKISTKLSYSDIHQIRVIPMNTNSYKIEIVYVKQEPSLITDNGNYCGIDVGLNNLFTLSFNNLENQNIILNGKPLKSINQYYNKKLAYYKSLLEKNNKLKTSKRINKLTQKRNNKIKDYLHKSTKKVIDKLKQNNISLVVIGKNEQWKQEINIGKKNNQNFVSIPHATAINMLVYKMLLQGINHKITEENYTSKCSAYDLETISKHDEYKGKRVKRGLFRTSNGTLINADINGASNILRKVIPNAFANGIEGLVVSPVVLNII